MMPVLTIFFIPSLEELEALRKIQTAAMVYKSLHGLASQYLNSLLSYRNEPLVTLAPHQLC